VFSAAVVVCAVVLGRPKAEKFPVYFIDANTGQQITNGAITVNHWKPIPVLQRLSQLPVNWRVRHNKEVVQIGVEPLLLSKSELASKGFINFLFSASGYGEKNYTLLDRKQPGLPGDFVVVNTNLLINGVTIEVHRTNYGGLSVFQKGQE
jgi:hypothetical protein